MSKFERHFSFYVYTLLLQYIEMNIAFGCSYDIYTKLYIDDDDTVVVVSDIIMYIV